MKLAEFFRENNKIAVGFSGGVDSAYLLYMAKKEQAEVMAYYVKSQFQPAFELEDAIAFAKQWDVPLRILTVDVLADERIKENPQNRCYFCKQHIFSTIVEAAKEDGFTVVVDGTNASDDANDRPGVKALAELEIKSPLRQCGVTKQDVRKGLKQAGIAIWDKPAYACLATRVATGEEITEEKLMRTEKAEGFMTSLGFRDFRIRCKDEVAVIQILEEQKELFDKKSDAIFKELEKSYNKVILDGEFRQS